MADKTGIYRNRKSLSLFEAACLVHGEDPEESFNRAWYSIDPEIRAGATNPQASAALIESMRGLLLGAVGQTWGELTKAFGAPGNTHQPIADIQDALSMMGMALPFEVKAKSDAPHSVVSVKRTRKTNITLAVEAARNRLIARLQREPSGDELYAFLEDGDETGRIVDWTEEAVTWQDTKGKCHDTKRKSVINLLSRIKSSTE